MSAGATTRYVAFFRNLNLGRPPAPTCDQLERAFARVGAESVQAFQVNGTLVFEAAGPRKAAVMLDEARANLRKTCRFQEPAFLRKVDALAAVIGRNPFESIDPATVYDCYVTILPPRFKLPRGAPYANAKGDVKILEYTSTEAFSVAYKLTSSPGSPNAFIERQFGVPATTRSWNTICRLVTKHG